MYNCICTTKGNTDKEINVQSWQLNDAKHLCKHLMCTDMTLHVCRIVVTVINRNQALLVMTAFFSHYQ